MLSSLAGIIQTIGFLPYLWGMIKKGKKPPRTTWFIWTTLDIIICVGMWKKGTLNPQIASAVVGACITTVCTLWWGIGGWSRTDIQCFAGALASIALWWWFDSPTVGIICGVAILAFGAIRMFEEIWKDPWSEDKASWTLFVISSVVMILGLSDWSIAGAAQPLTFLVIDGSIFLTIFIRPLWLLRLKPSR